MGGAVAAGGRDDGETLAGGLLGQFDGVPRMLRRAKRDVAAERSPNLRQPRVAATLAGGRIEDHAYFALRHPNLSVGWLRRYKEGSIIVQGTFSVARRRTLNDN